MGIIVGKAAKERRGREENELEKGTRRELPLGARRQRRTLGAVRARGFCTSAGACKERVSMYASLCPSLQESVWQVEHTDPPQQSQAWLVGHTLPHVLTERLAGAVDGVLVYAAQICLGVRPAEYLCLLVRVTAKCGKCIDWVGHEDGVEVLEGCGAVEVDVAPCKGRQLGPRLTSPTTLHARIYACREGSTQVGKVVSQSVSQLRRLSPYM